MPDLLSSINPFAAGAQALGGLINLGVGLFQKSKAAPLLKAANAEEAANQQLVQKNASIGLPSEQYNQAMKNIQRQQLFAMKKASDRRSGLALLPTIQDVTDTATGNLDVSNAQARAANQQRLIQYNNQKFLRDYNYAMGLKGMGNQNLYSGLDKLVAGGGQLLSGNFGSGNRNPYTGGATITGSLIE